MFDHVKFGVGDDVASKAFHRQALGPMGVVAGGAGVPTDGIELCTRGDAFDMDAHDIEAVRHAPAG